MIKVNINILKLSVSVILILLLSACTNDAKQPAPGGNGGDTETGDPNTGGGNNGGGSIPDTPEPGLEPVPPKLATVTLNWTPSTTYTDGTTMSNLAGHNIYYKYNSENYQKVHSIENPGVTEYLLEDLVAGDYVFAVTAVSDDGVESSYATSEVITIE